MLMTTPFLRTAAGASRGRGNGVGGPFSGRCRQADLENYFKYVSSLGVDPDAPLKGNTGIDQTNLSKCWSGFFVQITLLHCHILQRPNLINEALLKGNFIWQTKSAKIYDALVLLIMPR